MIPRDGADEVLDDLSLDIDERRNVLCICAGQVRQQPSEVEVYVAHAGLSLQTALVGHHERAESVQPLIEHVGGDETIAHQVLSPLRPHNAHLFASTHWSIHTGCCQEAIVRTIGYMRQLGLNEERQ